MSVLELYSAIREDDTTSIFFTLWRDAIHTSKVPKLSPTSADQPTALYAKKKFFPQNCKLRHETRGTKEGASLSPKKYAAHLQFMETTAKE